MYPDPDTGGKNNADPRGSGSTIHVINNNNILIAESRRRLRSLPAQPPLWTKLVIKADPEAKSGGANIGAKTGSQCLSFLTF